jgi:hypothetical protein
MKKIYSRRDVLCLSKNQEKFRRKAVFADNSGLRVCEALPQAVQPIMSS